MIASLASIGLLTQTGHSADATAGGAVVNKERFRGDYAELSDTVVEGTVETNVYAYAYQTTSGITELCLFYSEYDTSTGTYLSSVGECGPVKELTVGNGLADATFSGTFTDILDYGAGEFVTVTVTADLTATGKVQTTTFRSGTTTPDYKFVTHSTGMTRPASGSLEITGDVTFSTDDATGIIANVKSGSTTVTMTS
jgi:hypothetical protein